MTKLVSNFEYLFDIVIVLRAAEFWNLGHIQGIYKGALTQNR